MEREQASAFPLSLPSDDGLAPYFSRQFLGKQRELRSRALSVFVTLSRQSSHHILTLLRPFARLRRRRGLSLRRWRRRLRRQRRRLRDCWYGLLYHRPRCLTGSRRLRQLASPEAEQGRPPPARTQAPPRRRYPRPAPEAVRWKLSY